MADLPMCCADFAPRSMLRTDPLFRGDLFMRWVTRPQIRVNLTVTTWRVRRFVDPDADFSEELYVRSPRRPIRSRCSTISPPPHSRHDLLPL
jgi:hypothetical protein